MRSQFVPQKEEMIELTEEERQGQCAFLQYHFVGADEGVRKRCAQPLSEKEMGKVPRRQVKRRKTVVLCTIQHANTGAFDLTKREMDCLTANLWVNDEVSVHASSLHTHPRIFVSSLYPRGPAFLSSCSCVRSLPQTLPNRMLR